MIKIKKGLTLPINGEPKQEIEKASEVKKVALIGPDYVGMKPSMKVKEGDSVQVGQVLFEDKKVPGVCFTSPAAGKVLEINRGERRVFDSVVISVEGNSKVKFAKYTKKGIDSYASQEVIDLLVESGEWAAFRTRPFSKSPAIDSKPHSIFVTAIDTNPLAAHPEVIINHYKEAFQNGIQILTKLTEGKVYICSSPDSKINPSGDNVVEESFQGPHPAGNVGTHIHFLDPVGPKKTVWHIGYQDVIAIGKLFETGELFTERIVALSGPRAKNPRLVKTIRGANLSELSTGETKEGLNRIISGSVFGGRTATNSPFCYLGRFHNQVTILEEHSKRELLGWIFPSFSKFSVKNVHFSKLLPSKKYDFTTTTAGSLRSIVPIGSFEKVMPLDIQPTFLLRALKAGNTDRAQQLGCLELDEEDLALCTFVDPCKNEYGPALRDNLDRIEKDG
ncbi:MAG: Na(+)-translocating NADH-quinone reductase subunit A [Spirochaetota bacterium]